MTTTETFRREPHEVGVRPIPLAIGLVGAPMCWVMQLIVDYALSSYACYPFLEQRATVAPGWGHVWTGVIVINLLALVLAVAATGLSFINWRRLGRLQPDVRDDLVEAGAGRARFVAQCGTLAGIGFIAAIIFDLVAIIGSPICSVG